MVKTTKWIAASMVALGAAGAMMTAPVYAQPSIVVQVAPPAPRHEVVPAPRRGQVWVPGHWEWRGNRHAWVNGHFMRARSGYYYTQPAWVQQGDRWAYNGGGWRRGDRDGDGIRNRNDRDRDNDGVPNRFDNAPNNPNRR